MLMTVREFATKYKVPIPRVKAALNLGNSRRNGGAGSKAENSMVFDEQLILEHVYAYLMEDMRSCIDVAAKDNELIKRLIAKAAEEER